MRFALPLAICLVLLSPSAVAVDVAAEDDPASVSRFAELALDCLHREFPNKIAHVMSSAEEVGRPSELTPVFYGCFDWHSAVHGHWLLVRLLRTAPERIDADAVEAALDRSFEPERVAREVAYFRHDQRDSFERPYGIAWFLQLMAELRGWDDPRAARWAETLAPLETELVARTRDWLGKLAYPIRAGEHSQTAFAFGLMMDWAETSGDAAFADQLALKSMGFHLADVDCPLEYEPSGQDFLSPCLAEADLMRRVLPPGDYAEWLDEFLPDLPTTEEDDWLPLAEVTDRSDGKLAHLDGLHLSRAWMLEGMAAGLPDTDPRRDAVIAAAHRHAQAGLAAVTGEHYEGGHWLGSFATYLVTQRGIEGAPQPAEPAGPSAAALQTARQRMARLEPQVSAVIALNPAADADAIELDQRRAAGSVLGPLHGLPVLLKDNIEMRGLPTTAGSLFLQDSRPERDAFVTARLRDAGLLLLGKANLSEWANIRDEDSSSGWSAVGGLTRNPWDSTRSACGSSSGSGAAVAAGYVPFAVGTETNGSVVCPASVNGVVGIKPTVGLVSRTGIVPISSSQDTAGPMAVNVRAAALLLSAMEGLDPEDPATVAAEGRHGREDLQAIDAGLTGVRVGVVRSQTGFHEGVDRRFDEAVSALEAAGAEIVDDLSYPQRPDAFWPQSLDVLLHELKHDLNAYFATLPGDEPRTLKSLIAFNEAHADEELRWFGQDLLERAEATSGLEDPAYVEARDAVQAHSRQAIDGLLSEHQLDLLVMPTTAPAWRIDLVNGDHYIGGSSSEPAIAGYPHVTVPMGRVEGLPVGLSFVGTAFSEPVLIRAAHGFEQATRHGQVLGNMEAWRLGGTRPVGSD